MIHVENQKVRIENVTPPELMEEMLHATNAAKNALVTCGLSKKAVTDIMETAFRIGMADDVEKAMEQEVKHRAASFVWRLFEKLGGRDVY